MSSAPLRLHSPTTRHGEQALGRLSKVFDFFCCEPAKLKFIERKVNCGGQWKAEVKRKKGQGRRVDRGELRS